MSNVKNPPEVQLRGIFYSQGILSSNVLKKSSAGLFQSD